MADPEAVPNIADARRRKWLRLVDEARESGEVFMFNQEQPEPARVIRFPLERLVEVLPPDHDPVA